MPAHMKIDWKCAEKRVLSEIDFVEKLNSFKKIGAKRIYNHYSSMYPVACDLMDYFGDRYCINDQPTFVSLYTMMADPDDPEDYEGPKIFTTTPNKDEVDRAGMNGQYAYNKIQFMFKKQTGKTFEDAFGCNKDNSELYREIKALVPSPINYANPLYCGSFIDNISKADVSAAYPAGLSGKLPTLEGCIRVPGRVLPHDEYGVAFFMKSHHIYINEEYNTFRLSSNDIYMDVPTKTSNGKRMPKFVKMMARDDETLLCKWSDYELTDVMKELYDLRKTEPQTAKFVMNASIGSMQRNSNPKMCHVAAVALLRCNCDMVTRISRLENNDRCVMLVNTDSCSWIGGNLPEITVPKEQKTIGSFVSECVNGKLALDSSKKYQLMYDDGTVKTVWAGMQNIDKMQDLFPFGRIFDPEVNEQFHACGWKWSDEEQNLVLIVLDQDGNPDKIVSDPEEMRCYLNE